MKTVTRQDVVRFALKWNGWGNGSGYPGRPGNPACAYMGHGLEYSCADGVSFAFGKAGRPLVSMQAGFKTGYSYCPSGLAEAHARKAVIPSWKAQPADIIFVNTGSGAQPGHTELVYKVTGEGPSRQIWTIGWDSGPSNVDSYRGQGGVHRHVWACPVGRGNDAIMAVADADKLVAQPFGQPKAKKPKRAPTPANKSAASSVTNHTVVRPHRQTFWFAGFVTWLAALARKGNGTS